MFRLVHPRGASALLLDAERTCPGPVACDFARQTLAESEFDLLTCVATLEDDCEALRVTLHQAVAALHHVTTERDSLRRLNRRYADQLRVLVGVAREDAEARARWRAA